MKKKSHRGVPMALKVLLLLISVTKNWLLVIFEKDESKKKKTEIKPACLYLISSHSQSSLNVRYLIFSVFDGIDCVPGINSLYNHIVG
ncbi:hypothetical protein SAMN05660337_3411 [Maridesulfovibrio ferrireducens]|uniref:Uncharacterized protein n=1 Tax=Maridesulfovibrio ferrireducens TaxID=246191 RepID=A0A1G9LJJ1_9BACT|nr:hypothetical protein SAMN05660337_3411 [Maridesulfovibrio ferrireducens]